MMCYVVKPISISMSQFFFKIHWRLAKMLQISAYTVLTENLKGKIFVLFADLALDKFSGAMAMCVVNH